MTKAEGKFDTCHTFNDSFTIHWASKALDKLKDSGLACVISKKWAAHFWNKTIFFLYLMAIKFLSKNLELWVWIIYAAPSELSMLQDSLSIIDEVGKEMPLQPRLYIMAGD